MSLISVYYSIILYLWPDIISLRGSPSKSQVKEGGGDPVAEHRSETGGPGLKACSINVYCNSGTVSKILLK